MPTFLTNIVKTLSNLHVSSQLIKVAGLAAGLAWGIFGKDWLTGGKIALGSLGLSAGVSQIAIQQSKSTSVTVDQNALDKVGT